MPRPVFLQKSQKCKNTGLLQKYGDEVAEKILYNTIRGFPKASENWKSLTVAKSEEMHTIME